MAKTKISELAAAAALSGTEAIPVVQSGATVKATASAVAALARTVTGATTANGTGETTFGTALGPVEGLTIKKWLPVTDGETTLYIPLFGV
jgi:hypothetical protein